MTSNVTASRNVSGAPIGSIEMRHPHADVTGTHDPSELGELERAVLQLMWQHGTLTADRVREELDRQDRPLKDSTIRTVLRRLEEKGYLTHTLENRTFFYSPAEPAPMVAGRAVKRILEWFCEGSVEALLVGMVDSSVLNPKELKRLADRIAAAQNENDSKLGDNKARGGK